MFEGSETAVSGLLRAVGYADFEPIGPQELRAGKLHVLAPTTDNRAVARFVAPYGRALPARVVRGIRERRVAGHADGRLAPPFGASYTAGTLYVIGATS